MQETKCPRNVNASILECQRQIAQELDTISAIHEKETISQLNNLQQAKKYDITQTKKMILLKNLIIKRI